MWAGIPTTGFRSDIKVHPTVFRKSYSEGLLFRAEVERIGEAAAMAGELGVDDSLALRLMGTDHGLGLWHQAFILLEAGLVSAAEADARAGWESAAFAPWGPL